MMPEDLNLDPFDRLHVGKHGAFVFRINRRHEALARDAAKRRQIEEECRYLDRKAA